jgi:uncharacterized membrane protein
VRTIDQLSEAPGGMINKREMFMSFGLYAIGYAIMIGGLIYGAHLLHVPTHWIVVGAIVLVGVGILSGVKATRQKDAVS